MAPHQRFRNIVGGSIFERQVSCLATPTSRNISNNIFNIGHPALEDYWMVILEQGMLKLACSCLTIAKTQHLSDARWLVVLGDAIGGLVARVICVDLISLIDHPET